MELKVEQQSAIFYSLLAVGFSLSLGYMLHTSLILQDLSGKSVYSLLHFSEIGLLYNSILLHLPKFVCLGSSSFCFGFVETDTIVPHMHKEVVFSTCSFCCHIFHYECIEQLFLFGWPCRTVKDFEDWTNWLFYKGGIGDKGLKSWEVWWNEEHAHIQTTRGRIWECILSFRFFIIQYGVVYALHVTGRDKNFNVSTCHTGHNFSFFSYQFEY